MKYLFILFLYSLVTSKASAQNTIKAKDAYKYLGKRVTVCDTIYNRVASSYAVYYALYLGADKDFKRLLVKFQPSYVIDNEQSKRNITFKKEICVTGLVEGTKQHPTITVKDSTQMK